MKKLKLLRSYLPDRTVGKLLDEDQVLAYTLELPWVNNAQNISCIPEGTYLVKRDKTGRHQYYALQDVVGRTFIEIHPAASPGQLLGCIGLGKDLTGEYNLKESKEACDDFLEYMNEEDFLLVIETLHV